MFQPLPPLLEGSINIQRKNDNFPENSKEVYTMANKDKVLVRKQDKAEDRKFYNPFKSPYPTSKTPPMSTKKPFKPPFPAVPGEFDADIGDLLPVCPQNMIDNNTIFRIF